MHQLAWWLERSPLERIMGIEDIMDDLNKNSDGYWEEICNNDYK